MCELTKNLPIQAFQGVLNFQDSGGGFVNGKRKIQGAETSLGAMMHKNH